MRRPRTGKLVPVGLVEECRFPQSRRPDRTAPNDTRPTAQLWGESSVKSRRTYTQRLFKRGVAARAGNCRYFCDPGPLKFCRISIAATVARRPLGPYVTSAAKYRRAKLRSFACGVQLDYARCALVAEG